jgi:hypothetical protein
MFYTLMVYSSTKGQAVLGVFIRFQDFPSCFGVNDGIEHAACSVANACLCRRYTQVKTEHQYTVFRSGRDNRTLVRFFHIFHTPSPFHPQKRGKMSGLSELNIEQDISVNGAPVYSQVLKSRYYPNVQLCVLYPTTKTGPL